MMQQYKVKVRILVMGFPSLVEKYEVDGFTLKQSQIDENELNDSLISEEFDTRGYIYNVSFQLVGDSKLMYNYFESIDYYPLDVLDANEGDDLKTLRKKIANALFKNEVIVQDINCLARKLRLTYNIAVSFPLKKLFIYDKNNIKISESMIISSIPARHKLENINATDFTKKSRLKLNMKCIEEIEKQNVNFKIAMDFFYNSFELENINIKFVLLFSALESLFNLRNINANSVLKDKLNLKNESEGDKLTTIISVLSSKFLFYDSEEKTKEKEERIRYLYKKRGAYIHGNSKLKISTADENELREYVREILILYFLICTGIKLQKKENMARRILIDIYVDQKISINSKLEAISLRSTTHQESYQKCMHMLNENLETGKLEVTEIVNGYITKLHEK